MLWIELLLIQKTVMKLKEKYFYKNIILTKKQLRFSLFLMLLFSCFLGQAQTVTISSIDAVASEQGTNNASFRVNRTPNAASSLNVTISIAGTATPTDDYTPIATTVTIPAFSTFRMVNINGIVDDNFVEGDETIIITIVPDLSYTVGAADSATIVIEDNDVAGVNVDVTTGTTTEAGGTAEFVFTLTSEPTEEVRIPINSYLATEFSGVANIYLDATNWNSGETLVVTGVDDDIIDGDIVDVINTGNVISDDPNYDILVAGDVPQLTVTNIDDDVAGVNVDVTTGTTTEAGGTADFLFTLTSEPTADVTIPINGYDATEMSGPTSVVITPANWSTGEILTITGIDDAIVDGDFSDIINTGNVSSGDPIYDDLIGGDVPQLTVFNTDDDEVGVNIDTLTGTTTEEGGTAEFVFTLNSEPTADVSIVINQYDATETSGPASITLTPTNWNTGETLIITGVDDAVIDGDIEDVINTGNVTSADPNYQALVGGNVPQLTVTNIDDDGCGITPAISQTPPGDENEIISSTNIKSSFCGDFTVNLNNYTDSAAPAGMTLTWSQSSDALNANARIDPDRAQSFSTTGSFFGYFYDETDDCASGVIEVELISNDVPTIEASAGDENCDAGSGLLTATASDGASVRWFDSLTGGTQVGTGSSFTTPVVEETTIYYAEAIANNCPSLERTPVEFTIRNTPSSGTASNATACNLASTQQPLSVIDLDTRLVGDVDEGEWSFISGPTLISSIEINQENEVSFLEEPVGEYVFRYTTTGAQVPCSNTSTDVIIEVVSDCTPDPVDLEVIKTLDTPDVTVGDNVLFTIIVNNISSNEAKNVTIGDILESGFSYVADTASIGVYDAISGNWIFEDLEAGESASLIIEATVLAGGVYSNTAELLESFPVDDNTTNDTSTVTLDLDVPEGTDLVLTKTALSSRPLVGDQIVFTVTVLNDSEEGDAVSQIRISDVIDMVNFVVEEDPVPEPGTTYDIDSGIWTIPTLARGEEAVLTITVTVPNEGVFTNTASLLSSFPADSNAENNDAEVEVIVSVPTPAEEGFLFNQFSPNGDGTNDVLKFQDTDALPDFSNVSITIFDRYGNTVVEKNNITDTIIWDGLYEGKQSPAGTYFYVLNLVSEDGAEVKKGWIQLIR